MAPRFLEEPFFALSPSSPQFFPFLPQNPLPRFEHAPFGTKRYMLNLYGAHFVSKTLFLAASKLTSLPNCSSPFRPRAFCQPNALPRREEAHSVAKLLFLATSMYRSEPSGACPIFMKHILPAECPSPRRGSKFRSLSARFLTFRQHVLFKRRKSSPKIWRRQEFYLSLHHGFRSSHMA